jgi:hypothetical protein
MPRHRHPNYVRAGQVPPQLPELIALNNLRLERDRTWIQLGDDMKQAGFAVPARTLHYLVRRKPANSQPLERTLHKIRKYLEFVEDEERRTGADVPDQPTSV